MKLYSLDRVRLFDILVQFPNIHLARCGTLFVECVLTKEQASKINETFPQAVSLYFP